MAKPYATSSYSMSVSLHRRLKLALPRHGDRSKVVAKLIEMFLDGQVKPDVQLKSRQFSVAHNNTNVISI